MDGFQSKIDFAKLSNLMTCINKLYLHYAVSPTAIVWDCVAVQSEHPAGGIDAPTAGPWFNIKMSSYQHRKSHCGDKTVVRSSDLHNGISYTGKITSLYWISPQGSLKYHLTASPWGQKVTGSELPSHYLYISESIQCMLLIYPGISRRYRCPDGNNIFGWEEQVFICDLCIYERMYCNDATRDFIHVTELHS